MKPPELLGRRHIQELSMQQQVEHGQKALECIQTISENAWATVLTDPTLQPLVAARDAQSLADHACALIDQEMINELQLPERIYLQAVHTHIQMGVRSFHTFLAIVGHKEASTKHTEQLLH